MMLPLTLWHPWLGPLLLSPLLHTMIQVLPIEVFEIALDMLRDDTRALLVCSLVCRQWFTRARNNSFSQLRLKHSPVFKYCVSGMRSHYYSSISHLASTILESSKEETPLPSLASFIQHIELCPERQRWIDASEYQDAIQQLLRLPLPSLVSLCIHQLEGSIGLTTEELLYRPILSREVSNVVNLSLVDPFLHCGHELATILKYFPRVHHLELDVASFRDPKAYDKSMDIHDEGMPSHDYCLRETRPEFYDILPELKSLTLKDTTTVAFPRREYRTGAVKALRIGRMCSGYLPDASLLLNRYANSLNSLTLVLDFFSTCKSSPITPERIR